MGKVRTGNVVVEFPRSHRNHRARPIFTLLGKTCQYTFHVDAHGWLEHLYWGEKVSDDDSLLFLEYSNIALPFDPRPVLEVLESGPIVKDVLKEGKEGDLHDAWRAAANQKQSAGTGMTASEELEARRRENAAWRLMAMQKLRDEKVAKAAGDAATREGIAASGCEFWVNASRSHAHTLTLHPHPTPPTPTPIPTPNP